MINIILICDLKQNESNKGYYKKAISVCHSTIARKVVHLWLEAIQLKNSRKVKNKILQKEVN